MNRQNIEIKYNHELFEEVVLELGFDFNRINQNTYAITYSVPVQYYQITEMIESKPHYATHLYNLYATRNLFIKGHKYPSYDLWQQENKGLTLDHILPKTKYPLLTFVVGNWQALSQEANKTKGSKFSKADTVKVLGQF